MANPPDEHHPGQRTAAARSCGVEPVRAQSEVRTKASPVRNSIGPRITSALHLFDPGFPRIQSNGGQTLEVESHRETVPGRCRQSLRLRQPPCQKHGDTERDRPADRPQLCGGGEA
ncbi:hypothetical protein BIW11_01863 [Tropilaelaps mercedesae]|uniref:Uncharacterized protein n=1 Tax=Tropilaelaps mercedesae TaxID=418985 RepID=A0A1V9X747_9ACAR|nr:hypothetical protein BIW11_01863 [Tropilaelaps mercedesae]